MNCLLDTSALLAFFFGEPGAKRVQQILSAEAIAAGLAVRSAGEFLSRLRAEDWEDGYEKEWGRLSSLMAFLAPVTLEVAHRSDTVRSAASGCIPQVDALTAATVVAHDAVLFHRIRILRGSSAIAAAGSPGGTPIACRGWAIVLRFPPERALTIIRFGGQLVKSQLMPLRKARIYQLP